MAPFLSDRIPIRLAVALLLVCAVELARGELPNEPITTEALPSKAGAHWMWVTDLAFFNMADGKSVLLDGDAGKVLGMLSTGYGSTGLVAPRDGKVLLSPETYYSRSTRGTRTDVVTLYDPAQLRPVQEIEIPPKRSSNIPMLSSAALTDDDRFLLIYNFTPAQSVTVVDVRARQFVGEIETAGCAMVYPTGPRSFFSICGDGALLVSTLSEDGKPGGSTRTAEFFKLKDPVTEKAVRSGDTWLFVSFDGTVYPLQVTPKGIHLRATWSLTTASEQSEKWRSGGLQHLALAARSNRLYAVMHQGGPETHKDPGRQIWVYDVAARKKVQQITTRNKVGSIQVTQDATPLLFTSFIESSGVDVYDALSGDYLRSIPDVGQTPTTFVSP